MSTTIYRNATVFTAAEPPCRNVVEAFAVTDGRFSAVGSIEEVRASVESGAKEIDLHGEFVAPGFIDSHTHLLAFGQALGKVQLQECKSLADIQQVLVQARKDKPDGKRILGMGWLFDIVGRERPTAAMLDEVLPDVPVYLDSNDFHSMWVNTAALRELGITKETPDPVGGKVARDENGEATGMLYEAAFMKYGFGFVESTFTDADDVQALRAAFQAYLAAGVTGATDMGLYDKPVRALLGLIAEDGRLPFPVTGHWLLRASGDVNEDLKRLDKAISAKEKIAKSDAAAWLRIAGVKFIMDGTIDACTASMRWAYANGSNSDPTWTAERILPIAAAADRAGLQIAMHAMGDRTSEIALGAVEHCVRENGVRQRRHRIEHLESVTPSTVRRMAELGMVASMQPFHCDPAILDNWKAMLGDERAETGFPWQKFREAGVPITLGTDAPRASHKALPNVYIAVTGASVQAPERAPYHPERAFTPEQALRAITAGGAYAGEMEKSLGQIQVGLEATFIVLDVNPLEVPAEALLKARVRSATVRGQEATI